MKKYFMFLVVTFSALLMACNNNGKGNSQKNDTANVKKDTATMAVDANDKKAEEDKSQVIKFSPEQLAKDGPWRNDCDAFVKKVTKLTTMKSAAQMDAYNDLFKNKEVQWKLKFKEIKKDDKGTESLEFDLEPFGLRYKFFSGKPVMMGFVPAPGSYEAWKKIIPSSEVKISGVVDFVYFLTMTPGNSDTKYPVAQTSIKFVNIIQD